MKSEIIEQARQVGSDSQYREWIRTQPSAKSGQWAVWDAESGEGRSEACHYRTSANSGIGIKPEYSCIPLTSQEHQLQHRIGQYEFMPRWWWEKKVEEYLRGWIDNVNP